MSQERLQQVYGTRIGRHSCGAPAELGRVPRYRVYRLNSARVGRGGLGIWTLVGGQQVRPEEQHRACRWSDLSKEVRVPHARIKHVLEELSRPIGNIEADDMFPGSEVNEQSRVTVDLRSAQALLAGEDAGLDVPALVDALERGRA